MIHHESLTSTWILSKQKKREIIKQLYDIANLFDAMDNFENVRISFKNFARSEIGYHTSHEITVDKVLHDIIDTSLILAKRDGKGEVDKTANFKELQTGYNGKINRNPISTVPVPAMIEHPEFNILNKKLKFVPGGALYYWNETINVLTSS